MKSNVYLIVFSQLLLKNMVTVIICGYTAILILMSVTQDYSCLICVVLPHSSFSVSASYMELIRSFGP